MLQASKGIQASCLGGKGLVSLLGRKNSTYVPVPVVFSYECVEKELIQYHVADFTFGVTGGLQWCYFTLHLYL